MREFKPRLVQCEICRDLIYSKFPGHFVRCRCGKTACDQTGSFIRIIGPGKPSMLKEEWDKMFKEKREEANVSKVYRLYSGDKEFAVYADSKELALYYLNKHLAKEKVPEVVPVERRTKTWEIETVETLCKVIKVDAVSLNEAKTIVEELYHRQVFELDYNDKIHVTFEEKF